MHEKIREYESHLCHKNFSSLNTVHTHIRTMHLNIEYNCVYCVRAETYQSHVMEHEHGKRLVRQEDELVKQRKGHEGRHFVAAAFQMLDPAQLNFCCCRPTLSRIRSREMAWTSSCTSTSDAAWAVAVDHQLTAFRQLNSISDCVMPLEILDDDFDHFCR
ncbi:conserved hypothetical protein [Culex quinquefasciatus]|uniref:C2H2-type domain-containing protein n=1 Tax=Culex quinquefasciatus TaxID=7176 RepID=B0XKY0_CULQU|nr:conserved hypothetical protein [Culex quinquefasciatus]|eukprot:XP_001870302.1 conserved hypothetical protein [Culex quinquefasciatus]